MPDQTLGFPSLLGGEDPYVPPSQIPSSLHVEIPPNRTRQEVENMVDYLGRLVRIPQAAVGGVIGGLEDLVSTPARVAEGQFSQEELPGVARGMAMGLAGAGLGTSSVTSAPRTFGIFAGQKAATADLDALRKAQLWRARGLSPEQIWDRFGWFKDIDNNWKFEIPDTGAELGLHGPGTLAGAMDHPSLYEAYPQLRNIQVKDLDTSVDADGMWHPGKRTIEVRPGMRDEDRLSTMLHESQHAVQDIEGFAGGANPEEFLPQGFRERLQPLQMELEDAKREVSKVASLEQFTRGMQLLSGGMRFEDIPGFFRGQLENVGRVPGLMDRFQTAWNAVAPYAKQKQEAMRQYLAYAGEVEARNVQERYAQGSYFEHPHSTEGYPTYKQTIRASGVPFSLSPVSHNPFSHSLEPIDHDPFAHQVVPVEHDPFEVKEESLS